MKLIQHTDTHTHTGAVYNALLSGTYIFINNKKEVFSSAFLFRCHSLRHVCKTNDLLFIRKLNVISRITENYSANILSIKDLKIKEKK